MALREGKTFLVVWSEKRRTDWRSKKLSLAEFKGDFKQGREK